MIPTIHRHYLMASSTRNVSRSPNSNVDHCCYFKRYKLSYVILLIYVDDTLLTGLDIDVIRRLMQQLSKEFDMKDLDPTQKILGMQITRDKHRGILQSS